MSAFRGLRGVGYVGLDLQHTGPHVTLIGDGCDPFRAGAFDLVLCVHVLEHIEDDRSAIGALFDVVKPGGWALVSVPLQFDRPTHEDPSITDPDERARVFGERSHVRSYGTDLGDPLTTAGFQVDLDLAADVPIEVTQRFGLRNDENIFRCVKPIDELGPTAPLADSLPLLIHDRASLASVELSSTRMPPCTDSRVRASALDWPRCPATWILAPRSKSIVRPRSSIRDFSGS